MGDIAFFEESLQDSVIGALTTNSYPCGTCGKNSIKINTSNGPPRCPYCRSEEVSDVPSAERNKFVLKCFDMKMLKWKSVGDILAEEQCLMMVGV